MEKKETKPEEEQKIEAETKPAEVKEANESHKSELNYSSSSSYSSSQSSTRSNSPVLKKTNGKEEKLNSESLIDKLNKATINLTTDDPIKPVNEEENSLKTKHSDILMPIKSPTKVTVNNTSSLTEKAVDMPVNAPQLTKSAPVPFQLYRPAELSQKPLLINQPVNNYPAGYANNNNYPSSYPQLYYYYYQQQQQQQQLNPQQGQQIIMPPNMAHQIQNPLLTQGSQQQPLTFLQPFPNSIVINGAASSNISNSFVNTVQPSLFQPHLVNFSGSAVNGGSVNGANGMPVTLVTPISQPSHQSQLQQ